MEWLWVKTTFPGLIVSEGFVSQRAIRPQRRGIGFAGVAALAIGVHGGDHIEVFREFNRRRIGVGHRGRDCSADGAVT